MQSAFNAAFAKQLPSTISVGLEPGISFCMLPDGAHLAPAIEVTASSLGHLHHVVQRDLKGDTSGVRPRAKGSSQGAKRRSPRGVFWAQGVLRS